MVISADGFELSFAEPAKVINGSVFELPKRQVRLQAMHLIEVTHRFRVEPRTRPNPFDTDQARFKRESDRLLSQV